MPRALGRLAGPAAALALALAGTAAFPQPVPEDEARWLTTDLVWNAVKLIDTYQYKPEYRDLAAMRVREMARSQFKEPSAKFETCFDESLKSSRMKTALSAAVEAAVTCLKLRTADPDTQRQINARLLEVLAETASPHLPSIPRDRENRRIDFTTSAEAPPPASGGGIGLSLVDAVGGKMVVDSLYSSPAREQGIAPGDLVVTIDGRNAEAMSHDDVVRALQGEPGTAAVLAVRVHGSSNERAFSLQRKSIEALQERMTSRREGALLIVDLRSMEGGEAAMVEQAWQASGKGAKALVLDLRFNGGGTLEGAVDLADAILDKGTIATIEARSAADRQVFDARPGAIANGLPVVVLVGPQTAAGAEILAAALHDNRQAILVGQRTYGRGTIESLFYLHMRPNLPLKITTGEALRPDGSSFDMRGLIPDCISSASGSDLVEIARQVAGKGIAACPQNP